MLSEAAQLSFGFFNLFLFDPFFKAGVTFDNSFFDNCFDLV